MGLHVDSDLMPSRSKSVNAVTNFKYLVNGIDPRVLTLPYSIASFVDRSNLLTDMHSRFACKTFLKTKIMDHCMQAALVSLHKPHNCLFVQIGSDPMC